MPLQRAPRRCLRSAGLCLLLPGRLYSDLLVKETTLCWPRRTPASDRRLTAPFHLRLQLTRESAHPRLQTPSGVGWAAARHARAVAQSLLTIWRGPGHLESWRGQSWGTKHSERLSAKQQRSRIYAGCTKSLLQRPDPSHVLHICRSALENRGVLSSEKRLTIPSNSSTRARPVWYGQFQPLPPSRAQTSPRPCAPDCSWIGIRDTDKQPQRDPLRLLVQCDMCCQRR